MKLFAEITDSDLLFKLLHEAGASFFRLLGNGQAEVLYFSGNRTVHFKGKLDPEKLKLLEQTAWKVSEILIDESGGFVKISQ